MAAVQFPLSVVAIGGSTCNYFPHYLIWNDECIPKKVEAPMWQAVKYLVNPTQRPTYTMLRPPNTYQLEIASTTEQTEPKGRSTCHHLHINKMESRDQKKANRAAFLDAETQRRKAQKASKRRASTAVTSIKSEKIAALITLNKSRSPSPQIIPNGLRTRYSKPLGLQIPHSTLEELYAFLGLGSYSPSDLPSDVVFASFDFENLQQLDKVEAGFALLDSRDILQANSIVTHNGVAVGRSTKPFFYGTTVQVPNGGRGMLKFIKSCFPVGRKIVLVGHAVDNDLGVLQKLGFDVDPATSNIVGVFDTGNLHRTPSEFTANFKSLKDILLSLGCDFRGFHNSGNDANFTLKALLLMAAQNYVTHYGHLGVSVRDCQILRQLGVMGRIMRSR